MILDSSFKPRLYQQTILGVATKDNTLVVLPTGLGKTAISAMLAATRLQQYNISKVLFLAPTKPLVQQHLETYKKLFTDESEGSFAMFTGHVSPKRRQELWSKARFIFSTPQGMENDIISGRISLKDVSLLIIDEAHRAQGDYAYVYLAKNYHEVASHERILALTASPGANEEMIRNVCDNLFIESIEVKSLTDADVSPYTQKVDIYWKEVLLTEDFKKIQKYLQNSYDSKLSEAQKLGYLYGSPDNYSKTTLLSLQGALHAKISQGDKSFELLKTISLLAESLKVQHALELLETQSIGALVEYFDSLEKQSRTTKTKAVKNLLSDINFRSARIVAESLREKGVEHPKIKVLQEIISKKLMEKSDQKIILFTQFRDTAKIIKERLVSIASCEIFVGQAKKKSTGLSQKQQKEMLDRFRNDEFQILIATSVAEEGLDIPSVDSVIFYEPIPSAIRTVQRRGRTGRHSKGNVVVLVAKGTRDEAYRWSAHHKEKRMYATLKKLQKNYVLGVSKTPSPQRTIKSFSEDEPELKVVVDYREKGSAVIKELLNSNVKLDLAQLKVGDYQIDDDIVVEYKTVSDFVNSILDGRLLSQLKELRTKLKPIIIIEGDDDIYAQRQINPAAIRGMLATIVLSYQIPIIRTKNGKDTAEMLISLMKRSVGKGSGDYSFHSNKPWTETEVQEYIVSSLPSVGAKLSKELLKHFGSVRAVMNASKEDLEKINLIGKKKADSIFKAINGEYRSK